MATEVIVKAVVAGVFGLVALIVSLVLSVRIGRGLIRDLRQLGVEAHEASGVRLPSVMRRLAAGEQVDVETEVPRLEYDKNEIGEVGHALNTLQRAAVEAAVKQAELRSRRLRGLRQPRPPQPGAAAHASSPCSTPWNAAPRTPRSSPTSSASTTSPPACGGTPRAW